MTPLVRIEHEGAVFMIPVDGHPLDDEDVTVQVILTHTPTGRIATSSGVAPADAIPTVADVIATTGEAAMDMLTSDLEQAGGG